MMNIQQFISSSFIQQTFIVCFYISGIMLGTGDMIEQKQYGLNLHGASSLV